jgi:streptogramin lyase
MKRHSIPCAVALLLFSAPSFGQRDLSYDNAVVAQNRIDARDLGYPPVDIIPDGESGITSLTVAPNGDLFGATSGGRAHLFMLTPRHGYVQPLGVIPSARSVLNSVVVSAAGDVYIGTSPGGHLLRFTPQDEYKNPIQIEKTLTVVDLGEAVAGESIAALAIDRHSNILYGLTSPNAHFFRYSIDNRKFEDVGVIARKTAFGERFEKSKTMSRALVVDPHGMVFMSGEDGFFFRYDPANRRLEKLTIQVPSVPGREAWTRADAFLVVPSGTIFGGTSDGYLFRLDPEKLTVINLGKPLNQYRINGLVSTPDGHLYGVGGDSSDMARLFSYDPTSGAYDVLGFIDVNRRPYYTWQAYVVGALACGIDGTIYIGEDERISKLFLFFPYQPKGEEPRREP